MSPESLRDESDELSLHESVFYSRTFSLDAPGDSLVRISPPTPEKSKRTLIWERIWIKHEPKPACRRGYLFLTSEDAFEDCLVNVLSLGVTSVPTLDCNCRLVHLLDKPSHIKQLL